MWNCQRFFLIRLPTSLLSLLTYQQNPAFTCFTKLFCQFSHVFTRITNLVHQLIQAGAAVFISFTKLVYKFNNALPLSPRWSTNITISSTSLNWLKRLLMVLVFPFFFTSFTRLNCHFNQYWQDKQCWYTSITSPRSKIWDGFFFLAGKTSFKGGNCVVSLSVTFHCYLVRMMLCYVSSKFRVSAEEKIYFQYIFSDICWHGGLYWTVSAVIAVPYVLLFA